MNEIVAPAPERGIVPVKYEEQVPTSYLDYAFSVIVGRSLPDLRDGLKPVHRRILYAMQTTNVMPNTPYVKCASIVGEVMGKYHPHGDSSIYDALVRMGQHWEMKHVLIDPQGNFGSIDGDNAAAMRYTEARMHGLATHLMTSIDKKVVPFRPNYDGKNVEPTVLPAEFPNILVNGTVGIAVGMASDIPTHNLREVCDAACMVLDNPDVTVDDIMKVMPGPDFPHGGIVKGRSGIRKAFSEGRGAINVFGVAEVVKAPKGSRMQIVVSELPFQVNRAKFIEKVAMLVREKRIEGISDIRDESDRDHFIRVVIDVKNDADANIVLQALYRYTDLNTRYHYNMVCLLPSGRPETMGVVQILREFVEFRRQTVTAALRFDLDAARGRQDRMIGLYAATTRMDEIVRLIRASEDPEAARAALLALDFPLTDEVFVELLRDADPDFKPEETWRLSIYQVDHILKMSLQRLTAQDQKKIITESKEIGAEITDIIGKLQGPGVIDSIIRQGMLEVAAKYAGARRTVIEELESEDIEDEDLIERKDVVVTLMSSGYVKRTDVDELRAQGRGGKGRSGITADDNDYVVTSFVCSTRSPLLIFTDNGRVYGLKAWKLPDAPVNGKGRPIVRYLELAENESVMTIIPLPESGDVDESHSIMFVSDDGTQGKVRRNALSEFTNIRRNGKVAIDLGEENLRLVSVLPVKDDDDLAISTAAGQTIRFPIIDIRQFSSRQSAGNRAMTLAQDDRIVSACVLPHIDYSTIERRLYLAGGTLTERKERLVGEAGEIDLANGISVFEAEDETLRLELSPTLLDHMRQSERHILSVSENGFGKRSSSHDFRVSSRGGKGIVAAGTSAKTGKIVACTVVSPDDDLVLSTNGGQTIRTRVKEIRVMGRDTQGVKLFTLAENQKIVSVAVVSAESDDLDEATSNANESL